MSNQRNDIYTLNVSGEQFQLTKSQLESEPDNYFLSYFFGDFSEANQERKEIDIMAEPGLFRLIQAHLRGYEIFPLPEGAIPYMSSEAILKNLLKEADFYGLQRLTQQINEEIQRRSMSKLKRNRMVITITGSRYPLRSFQFPLPQGEAAFAAFTSMLFSSTDGTAKSPDLLNEEPADVGGGNYTELVGWNQPRRIRDPKYGWDDCVIRMSHQEEI